MDKLVGTWRLESSTNFDKFLSALGKQPNYTKSNNKNKI